jgi:hypothetical protein
MSAIVFDTHDECKSGIVNVVAAAVDDQLQVDDMLKSGF